MSRIGLFVKFTAQAGQRDALLQQPLHAAELVADAPGCELWLVSTSPTEAETVCATEVWRSQAEHDASLAGEAVKSAIGRTGPLLAGPPQRIDVLPAGGKGLDRT
ncbi:MAG TPA: putative quinol monooxygenase [Dehalococcoidia bacterium]|jgi:quinol monooxygenase YgiN